MKNNDTVGGNKGNKIEKGMVVSGKYHKVLDLGVLVELTEVVGVVTPQGNISLLETPVAVKGKVVGKQGVKEFPGNRSERDGLLEALKAATPEDMVTCIGNVNLVVKSVTEGKGRLLIELSESEYLRRKARGDLKEGDIITVEVKNATNFGVFCAVTPYEDGLVHISQVKRRSAAPQPGEKLEVVVVEFKEQDDGKLRCGLSEVGVAAAKAKKVEVAQAAKAALALEAGKALLPKLVAHVEAKEEDKTGPAVEGVEGTVGTARVTGVTPTGLSVVFIGECAGEVPGTLPDDQLFCPKPSVSRVGNLIKVRVIGVDLTAGTVTVSRKGMAKPKPGKK